MHRSAPWPCGGGNAVLLSPKARARVGEHVAAIPRGVQPLDNGVCLHEDGLVLVPVHHALVQVGPEPLGKPCLGHALDGVLAYGTCVEQRPRGAREERRVECRGVLLVGSEDVREQRTIEVEKHAAHVKDDVSNGGVL